jgi:L-threonylcarbamoyladenylate synthase
MQFLNINQENLVSIVVQSLIGGKVLVVPTDTVYGLICDARNKEAARKIFEVKQRSFEKPIGLFIKDLAMAKRYAHIQPKDEPLIKKYWPGQITFIFKRKQGELAEILFAKGEKIGMRIPDNSLIQGIFEEIDFPLAQTSANLSGQPAPLSTKEVTNQFKDQKQTPDLIINGGDLVKASASTVIDLTEQPPVVLRQGEIKIKF